MNRWKSWILSLTALALVLGCGSSLKVEGDRDATDDPGPELTVDITPDPTTEPTIDPPVDPTTEPPPPDLTPDLTPDSTPLEGITGDSCSADSDCMGVPSPEHFCLHEVPMGPSYTITFPNGYCTAYCSSGTECGPGADCVDFTYAGMCFRRCTSDGDCRTSEGYVCYPIPYVTTEPYCIPYV